MSLLKKFMSLALCAVLTASLFLSSGVFMVSAKKSDFVVEGTVLVEYIGEDSEVVIPSDMGITEIGDYAFAWSWDITSVTVPDSVIKIGELTFVMCEGLEEIKIGAGNPAYSSVSGVLFNKAKTLLVRYPAGKPQVSYTIPNGVTAIGSYAFGGCAVLTNIVIPTGVQTIGVQAFYGCWGLTGITLPSTVTDIGEDAFGYCYNLTNIHVAAGNTAYASIDGVLFNGAKTLLIQYPAGNTRTEYTVPDGVTEIGAAAFMFCEKLEKVSMPEGVTEIGDFAFVWCEELIAFTFPDSLTRIGYGAFEDTGWLINQPGGLLYIGRCLYTYKGKMPSNAAIVIAAGIVSISSGAFDRFDSMKSVTLPDGLLCIGEWAFYGCEKLTEIAIPDSVVEIGTMAFEECAAMTQIKVGAGNAAYSSLDGVLFDKEKTVLIKYPEGKTQTAYVVPEGVTELAEWAFWNAAFLGVTLPDSLISIQLGAFGKCGNLEDIYIPPSVTSMGESVFGWWYMYEDFVVYGELGSYAETYCWDNYVPFLPVPGDFLWGDVDRQNGLDISDARMVLQYLVGKITLTPTQLSLANVDGKNGVTITDARLMLQRLVGKIAKFPVEK